MQKLNYKIILVILVLAAMVVLFFTLSPRFQKQEIEQNQTEDPVEKALQEVGISLEKTRNVLSFINPYSQKREIEYLAPEDDSIESNSSVEFKNKTLVVKSIDIQSGAISTKKTEIVKPIKVVWGNSGSIAYLSADGQAYYVSRDRSKSTKLSDYATDIALSDKSELVAVVTGQTIRIFQARTQPLELVSYESNGNLNSSAGTNEGLVFKSKTGWEKYISKNKSKKLIDAQGETIGQYAAGDFVTIGSQDKSYVYNYADESQVAMDGNLNPSFTFEIGNGVIFATTKPGQSEDKTFLECFNKKTGSLFSLYAPAVDIESFEASSGTIQDDIFYFTWGLDLNSLKISNQELKKCTD